MTEYDKKRQLRLEILATIQNEIRHIQNLEEEGYTLSDHKYMRGQAYWWYSDYGDTRVTVTHNNSKPLYPVGDWHLSVTTMNGEIDNDNTIAVAFNILAIRYNFNEVIPAKVVPVDLDSKGMTQDMVPKTRRRFK